MFCYFRRCCCALLCIVLFAQLHATQAGYILEARVLSYASTSSRKSNGFCCRRPTGSVCDQDCSNRFLFCLRATGLDPNNDTCTPMNQYATGVISNDTMVFERDRDLYEGVPNPLIFTGESWPGTMDFYVRVDDVDPIESLVARFLVPVNATPTGNNSVISTTAYRDIQNQGQFIRVEFQLSCAINFFGENCSCACQGRDDNGGHYMCNNDCGINCMQGFRDPLTNCTRCVLAEGCSPVGGCCNSTHGCICKEGFTGVNCAECKNYCGEFHPCLNGGTCRNTLPELDLTMSDTCILNLTCSYTCNCPIGYEGRLCDIDIDDCGSDPCLNGGTCQDRVAGFQCLCPSGYKGTICEVMKNPAASRRFLGPFIGAAIAIAVLLIIIAILVVLLFYTLWQWKARARGKQQNNADSTQSITHSHSAPADSPTAKKHEDIASEEDFNESDPRKTSETFDNPIYDQLTLSREEKVGSSSFSEKRDSKPGSLSSSRSFSMSSSHGYLSPSSRALENGISNPMHHSYEDIIKNGSEECLNTSFRISITPSGSVQQATRAVVEVEKLTVINETYDPLPCHSMSISPPGYFQNASLQTLSAAGSDCFIPDGRLAGHSIITTSEVHDNDYYSKPGSLPKYNGYDRYQDNSCNMAIEMETSEQ